MEISKAISKNHHYIPKCVLRRFCYSGHSLLLFDASNPQLGYRERNIEKAFQEFHANTILSRDGKKTDYIEKWLAKYVDDPLGRLLKRSENDISVIFRDNAKMTLSRYVCSAFHRAPKTREMLAESLLPSLKFASSLFQLAEAISPSVPEEKLLGVDAENFEEAFYKALPMFISDDVLEVLNNGQLIVGLSPEAGDRFCISEFPVMRYDDPRIAKEGYANEVWLIISPRIAVSFVMKSPLPFHGHVVELPNEYVRRLNFDFAMRSQFVASDSLVHLHRTVRHLGGYTKGRDLTETRPEMFRFGGKYY